MLTAGEPRGLLLARAAVTRAEAPFFVVGNPRSGTKMFRELLQPQPRHLDSPTSNPISFHASRGTSTGTATWPSAPTSIGWGKRCGEHERSGTGIAAASTSTTSAGGRSAIISATGLACSKPSSAACTSRRSPPHPDHGRRFSGATRPRCTWRTFRSSPRSTRGPASFTWCATRATASSPRRTRWVTAAPHRAGMGRPRPALPQCRVGARSGPLPRPALRRPRGRRARPARRSVRLPGIPVPADAGQFLRVPENLGSACGGRR